MFDRSEVKIFQNKNKSRVHLYLLYIVQFNWKSSEKLLEIFPKPDGTDKEHTTNTFIKETLSIYFLFHFKLMCLFCHLNLIYCYNLFIYFFIYLENFLTDYETVPVGLVTEVPNANQLA